MEEEGEEVEERVWVRSSEILLSNSQRERGGEREGGRKKDRQTWRERETDEERER